MSDQDTPQPAGGGPVLSVEPPKSLDARRTGGGGGASGIVIVLLLAVVGLQAVIAYRMWDRGGRGGAAEADGGAADLGALKATALRLEEHGALTPAADTWERYLGAGGGDGDAARALVRYRVGKLRFEAKDYDGALVAFVRAEKEGLADDAAKRTTATRIIDCLRALGRYGAIGSELDRRTRVGGAATDASAVVARYAGETLTRAAFDRLLEAEVDRSLQSMAGRMPPEAVAERRKQMLRFYREPQTAKRFLEQWVVRQVMARRARELDLDRDDAFRDRIREIESLLLVQQLQQREVDDAIKPTAADLEAFHAANKGDYHREAEASLRVIAFDDRAKAEAARNAIATAKDSAAAFKAASAGSLDEASKANGGAVDQPFVRGRPWGRFGAVDGLEADVFAAADASLLPKVYAANDRVLVVWVDAKREATDPSFAEVEDRVRSDYTARKRTELNDALVDELKRAYDVSIDLAAATAAPKAPAGDAAGDAKTGDEGKDDK